MTFTSGEQQREEEGTWWYVLEWLTQRGVWVAYAMSERYAPLRSDVAQLERLGYHRDRRRVRHWLKRNPRGDGAETPQRCPRVENEVH